MADTPDFNTLMRQAAQCIDIVYQTYVLAISANRLEEADALITTMNMAVNNMEAMLRDRLKLNISPTNNNQCYYDPEELEPAHKAADSTISSEEFDEYIKKCAEVQSGKASEPVSGVRRLVCTNRSRSRGRQYLAIANLIVALKDKEIVGIGVKDEDEDGGSNIKYDVAMFDLGRCEFKKTDDTVIPLQDISIIYTMSMEAQDELKSEFGGN